MVVKDGNVLAVIRPADPEKALAEARAIHALNLSYEEAQARLDEMLSHQEYTFRGIATHDPNVLLDHEHKVIAGDTLRPGDSLVPYDDILKVAKLVSEGPGEA